VYLSLQQALAPTPVYKSFATAYRYALVRISNVPGSNLHTETCHPKDVSELLQENALTYPKKTPTYFLIIYNALFTPIMQFCFDLHESQTNLSTSSKASDNNKCSTCVNKSDCLTLTYL
jgi:hypothetical protein